MQEKTKDAFLYGWEEKATTDENQISRWNQANPRYNCGAVARKGEFWFLDIDNPQYYQRIEQETGHSLDALCTLAVCSSGEKRHFYFRADAVSDSQLSNFRHPEDITKPEMFSVRVHNRYVVGPDSIHPKTGQPYTVVKEPDIFGDGDIICAPAWLVTWLTKYKPVGNKLEKTVVDSGERVPVGGRDNFLFDQAKRLRDANLLEADAVVALDAINHNRCTEPMPRRVVEQKIKSAFSRPPRKQQQEFTPVAFKHPKVEGTHLDFVFAPLLGQQDGWFPRDSVSLLAGASGAGKTSWMIDALEHQQKKEGFLGHGSFGLRYLVLMIDRGEGSHRRTMKRLGYDAKTIPVQHLRKAGDGEASLSEIRSFIEDLAELPEVVFIEGADLLVEDAGKPEFVTPFLDGLQQIAAWYHIAIVLSVGSPKQKIGEGYTQKRDCVYGSQVWGRKVETIVVIQYPAGDDTEEKRVAYVLPRNAGSEKFNLAFQHGKLVVDNEPEIIEEPDELGWFKRQSGWFTASDLERGLQIRIRTAQRRIKDAYARDILIKKPGRKTGICEQYKWNDSPSNPVVSQETRRAIGRSLRNDDDDDAKLLSLSQGYHPTTPLLDMLPDILPTATVL